MHTLFGRRAAGQQLKVGPPLFPDSFVTLLKKQDPCNVPLSSYKGKRIFALSGEQDTLVNFVVGGSEDFVAKLKHEGVNVQVFIDKAASVLSAFSSRLLTDDARKRPRVLGSNDQQSCRVSQSRAQPLASSNSLQCNMTILQKAIKL